MIADLVEGLTSTWSGAVLSDTFDVIVVGFGFAGGIAAIEAHDAGARVLLLEKQPDPGGISVCSAGRHAHRAQTPAQALAYLTATNAGTTPEPVLRVLADGMLRPAAPTRKRSRRRSAPRCGLRTRPGNYPLPGYRSFGFAYVDDAARLRRGAGLSDRAWLGRRRARCSSWCWRNVRRRPGITVRLGTRPRGSLVVGRRSPASLPPAADIDARRARVVLASGGFEAAPRS